MRKIANLLGMASLALLAAAPAFAQGSNDVTVSLSSFATDKDAAATAQTPSVGNPACNSSCCNSSCCNTGCCNSSLCDPLIGLDVFGGVDDFRGVSDFSLSSNFGVVGGVNAGILLPGTAGENGWGWQLGTSYGIYDPEGRVTALHPAQTLDQLFVTTGFYRKTQCDRGWNFGLVYDWMSFTNWGISDTTGTMGQFRGQVEYCFNRCDSLGLYGTLRDQTYVSPAVPGNILVVGGVIDRPINQLDLFWDHKFCSGADGRLWIGLPEQDTVPGVAVLPTQLLSVILGAEAEVPLSQQVSLYAGFQYAVPAASAGPIGAVAETYDISVGLVWHPGRCCCGRPAASAPYLPVANNRTFLVDSTD